MISRRWWPTRWHQILGHKIEAAWLVGAVVSMSDRHELLVPGMGGFYQRLSMAV
jgi:hypothetical protein